MRRLTHGLPASAKCKTISECGLPIGGAEGRVMVEHGRVVPGQVRLCRHNLRCAVCERTQWRVLGEKVAWFADRHEEQDGWFAHSVLTIPHRRSDSLATLLHRLGGSWQDLKNHVEYRQAKSAVDGLAVVVLQINYSPKHGWHPHYHVLWMMRGDGLGQFPAALAAAWETQTGRRGEPARQVLTEMVQTREGYWAYLSKDSARHPTNDCLHPDHSGCPNCRPAGTFRGDRVEPTQGPRYGKTPGPVWPGNFEVFSEIGGAALHPGAKRAQGILRDYLAGTVGCGRVRQLGHLSRRFGTPDVEEYKRHIPGGERLWIAGDVFAAVELANRGTGSPVDAIESPEETARVWTSLLGDGRRIIIGVAPDDGAPMLQFES